MKMERLSEREKFLLGYESQRSFEGPSSSPFEGSDIDFDDVFGGPPRRFSAPGGTRYSSDGVMDTKRCSSFGHLSAEKPVFGEESSTSRRKYQSNDFFDDIFQGVKSCSSPRRVMNPSNSEPFGTSLPAQFSLPTTSTEVKDYPTFGSCSSFKKKGIASSGISSPALSRFSSQAMQEHDDFRSDVWLSDCPSPLSNVISRWNGKSSYVYRYNETNMSGSSNEDSKTTESPIDIDQSHFSMYKWAGGEAPLVMPPREKISSRLGEKDKLERWSSSNGRMSDAEAYHIVEKEVPMKPKTEIGETTQVIAESSSDCTMFSNTSEETKSTSLPEISLSEKTKKEVSMFTKQDCTTDLKTLRSILLDDIEVKVEGKQNAEKTTKKHGGKRISSSRTEVTKADIQDSPKNPGGDLKRSGVRGRVKNFVKIFNHDNYSKPRSNISTQNQSSRWDAEINALVNGATLSAIEMDTEMQFPEMSTKQDTSFVLDENVEQPEDLHSQMKSTIHTSTNTSSHPKEDSPFSDSVPDGSEVTSDKIDGYQENILIQYLSDNQVELSQSSEDQEAIKALDAKILKWSTGKTGNIRSLLSTLQYVLWDDSGWKPVPLVNIIEGNAVKRAYQKALLCLHPDKLQQKGAAFHQKYIAEKVFDILQEAWDHFNSLGSI